ncbi:MAG TPA: GYF domain-containing protein [Verrucomicrobiae bacterium]|nr:GYF domain-containing protein [Verrucomicrobiae bacterium]
MYKIIGADGKEYGPVTAEQLREWIRQGRANAQTRAQTEESPEWKSLAEFSEFADVLGTIGGVPTLPPVVGAVDPEALAAQILAQDYTIEIGRCIGRGWDLVMKDFWLLVGTSFLAGIIAAGAGLPIVGLIIGGPMMGGLYALYLKRIRGRPATLSDAFVGFSTAFTPLMLAKLVSSLLTGLGFLCCILPGIYLAVAWIFALPLVIDKKLDFWPAMELSRRIVTKHWWLMLGFLIVCGLVLIAGLLACCVGVFITTAVAQAALMYAYDEIFATRPAQTT